MIFKILQALSLKFSYQRLKKLRVFLQALSNNTMYYIVIFRNFIIFVVE